MSLVAFPACVSYFCLMFHLLQLLGLAIHRFLNAVADKQANR